MTEFESATNWVYDLGGGRGGGGEGNVRLLEKDGQENKGGSKNMKKKTTKKIQIKRKVTARSQVQRTKRHRCCCCCCCCSHPLSRSLFFAYSFSPNNKKNNDRSNQPNPTQSNKRKKRTEAMPRVDGRCLLSVCHPHSSSKLPIIPLPLLLFFPNLRILNLFLTLPPTPAPIAANPPPPPPPPPPIYADVLSTKIPPFPPPPSTAADGVPLPRLYPPALPPPTAVLPPTPEESVTQSIPAPLPISVRRESLPAPPLMCVVASPFVVAADDEPRKKLLRFPAPPSSLSSRWW